MLNVLFFVVLKAVEDLVEQRKDYVDSQHRAKVAETKVNVLKDQVAQLELMLSSCRV